MLEVQVIASGSDGNCTVIQLDDEAIMIDAGLSYSKTHKLLEREDEDAELKVRPAGGGKDAP
jgi:Cft2 family RNA processing exonuclease